jgi:hypothetical protein
MSRVMSGCWNNSYLDAIYAFEGFDISAVYTKIAVLSKEAGLQDAGEDDIAELLESHSVPLTNDELKELDK